jgi:Protein of unknown function (DUF1569)
MKTLANPGDKDEVVARLRTIGLASERRWGRMTAPQMICHLSDAFRVSTGERKAISISNWFSRSLFKWAGLWFPVPWPHGVRTVPECDARLGGTPPAGVESDMRQLRDLLERFTNRPRVSQLQPHPIFGQLSEKEWMRWGYLHMDHHLRQFGA